jgi:hypothetical protein
MNTNESLVKNKGQLLQEAYRMHYEPYAKHFQYAVTLTLKLRETIKTPIFDNYDAGYYTRMVSLNDEILSSRAKYFLVLLNKEIFRNKRKREKYKNSAKLLAIVAEEGRTNGKRPHLHIALGNLPFYELEAMTAIIKKTWQRCDFAYKEINVQSITSGAGWLGYLTKEVGYCNNDVLNVTDSYIPTFLKENN